jgi:hypothetical protein
MLLALALDQGGVLATSDQGLRELAVREEAKHVLVIR